MMGIAPMPTLILRPGRPLRLVLKAEFDPYAAAEWYWARPPKRASRAALALRKARRLSWRTEFQGLPISVETSPGEAREWKDPHDGSEGRTVMAHPYGYIRGTLGLDGDQIDVFIGPHEDAPVAYVITQMKAPDFMEPDEAKVMLGFGSPEEAKTAYRKHYDDGRFFGWMDAVPVAELLDKLRAGRKRLGLGQFTKDPGAPDRPPAVLVLQSRRDDGEASP